jgi:hypothetical protein
MGRTSTRCIDEVKKDKIFVSLFVVDCVILSLTVMDVCGVHILPSLAMEVEQR